MKRDPVTGFEYPFYYVLADVWIPEIENYERQRIANTQTYEEALSVVKSTPVNADLFQLTLCEDSYFGVDSLAIKVSVEGSPGYEFYDPNTGKDIE